MGAVAPRGMHGFSPDAPHSMASFISSDDYDSSLHSITDVFARNARALLTFKQERIPP